MHHNSYDNRELSWLKFNQRVLQEAADPSVPLIERLRFIGIFSNNLDEFFKVRYATVKRIDLAGKSGKKVLGGFNAGRLLKEITQVVIKNQAESLDILASIHRQLQDHDIFIIDETEVTQKQAEFLREFFLQKVSPALVTIMLNDIDKVPNLTDLKAYLAVKMVQFEKDRLSNRYILIEIPSSVERFVVIPSSDGKKYVIFWTI